MCGGRMTVEEALRFKRLEDATFDEEYRMMRTDSRADYEGKEFRSLEECGVILFDESGVRDDVLDAFGV